MTEIAPKAKAVQFTPFSGLARPIKLKTIARSPKGIDQTKNPMTAKITLAHPIYFPTVCDNKMITSQSCIQ